MFTAYHDHQKCSRKSLLLYLNMEYPFKPNIRAIDVGDLLLSETSESEYGGGLKARDYRGGSKGTSDPS